MAVAVAADSADADSADADSVAGDSVAGDSVAVAGGRITAISTAAAKAPSALPANIAWKLAVRCTLAKTAPINARQARWRR